MICKNCETENTDGSIYCKSCGFRIDGKKKCPACDCLNDDGNIYCNQCGARIDGKKICSNCGGEIVGVFCSKCGTRHGYQNLQTSNNTKAKTNTKTYVCKILDITSSSVLMLCAVLSLIFIFFVGLIYGEKNQEIPIFYFFGKAYKNLKLLFPGFGNYSASCEISGYLNLVMCTAVIGISIICCLIFTTLAIVRFIKKLCFGGEKSSTLFSLLSVIFYYVCATSLRNVFYVSVVEFDEWVIDFTYSILEFNSITQTGSSLGCILLLMYFGLEITKKLITINKCKIVNFVFTMINVILLIVLVTLINNSFVKIVEGTNDRCEVSTSFSIISFIIALASPKVEILNTVIYSGVIQAFFVLVIFFALFSLAKSFSEEKNSLAYSICIFALLLIVLILHFIVINKYLDYFKILNLVDDSELAINCTQIIVSFIISFILLFVNIIHSALKAKPKTNNDTEIKSVTF